MLGSQKATNYQRYPRKPEEKKRTMAPDIKFQKPRNPHSVPDYRIFKGKSCKSWASQNAAVRRGWECTVTPRTPTFYTPFVRLSNTRTQRGERVVKMAFRCARRYISYMPDSGVSVFIGYVLGGNSRRRVGTVSVFGDNGFEFLFSQHGS